VAPAPPLLPQTARDGVAQQLVGITAVLSFDIAVEAWDEPDQLFERVHLGFYFFKEIAHGSLLR
jgi:hypothetical protein